MNPQKTWLKHRMECPEGKGEAELLSQWSKEIEGNALCGISCNNQALSDLSGSECQWSCWDKVSINE